MSAREGQIRTKIGFVKKVSSDKTVSVLVETLKRHKLYKKVYKSSKKYLVHDGNNEAKVGDKVLIKEGRPISKRKSWRLTKVIEAAVSRG